VKDRFEFLVRFQPLAKFEVGTTPPPLSRQLCLPPFVDRLSPTVSRPDRCFQRPSDRAQSEVQRTKTWMSRLPV